MFIIDNKYCLLSIINMSDLEILKANKYYENVKKEEEEKLKEISELSSKRLMMEKRIAKYSNLSIHNIIKNTIQTVLDVFEDIKAGDAILPTIFKDDRSFYIGILLVLFAFSLYLINITN